jgi:hypothetical protein
MMERVKMLRPVDDQPWKKGQSGNPRERAKEEPKKKATRDLTEALLRAAETVGFDGKGRDGLAGYLTRIAVLYPATMSGLLARNLSLQLHDNPELARHGEYQTFEQAAARIKASGIPIKEMIRLLRLIDEDGGKAED